MLKKLTVIFAILTGVTFFCSVALAPFAARDTVNDFAAYIPEKRTPELKESYDAQSVESIALYLGRCTIRIEHSDNEQIHLSTNEAGFRPWTVEALVYDGQLTIRDSIDYEFSFPFSYSPKIFKEMVGASLIPDYYREIVLQVPDTVKLDLRHAYASISIAPDVKAERIDTHSDYEYIMWQEALERYLPTDRFDTLLEASMQFAMGNLTQQSLTKIVDGIAEEVRMQVLDRGLNTEEREYLRYQLRQVTLQILEQTVDYGEEVSSQLEKTFSSFLDRVFLAFGQEVESDPIYKKITLDF